MNTRTASQSQTIVTQHEGTPNVATVIGNLNNLFTALLPLLRAAGYEAHNITRVGAWARTATSTLAWSDEDYRYAFDVEFIAGQHGDNTYYRLTHAALGNEGYDGSTITTHDTPAELHKVIAHRIGAALI